MRRGLSRRAGLGREHRRPEGADARAPTPTPRCCTTGSTRTPWIENLAADPATRSNTSVCLKIVDPAVARLPTDAQARVRQGRSRRCSRRRGVGLRHRRLSRRAAGLAHLVRLDGRDGRPRGADALARLGLRRGQGRRSPRRRDVIAALGVATCGPGASAGIPTSTLRSPRRASRSAPGR